MIVLRWLQYLVLQTVICVIGALTAEQCAELARRLAWLMTDVFGFRRRVIEENLKAVYPDLDDVQLRELRRQMWYHLVMMGCEVVHMPRKMHETNYRKFVKVLDQPLMTQYLIDYRPLVAVSGHFGNFEVGGFLTGLLGMPSYTVARTMDNPFLEKYVTQFRRRHGQFIFPKDGSAAKVQKVMEGGAILGILGDQHAGTKGCWIDFLGRPAACHKAIALFTLTNHAPMMVTYCKHAAKPMTFEVGLLGLVDPWEIPEELQDVRSLTQWYNDRMAIAIHADPSQYWWVHRRWKEKPVRETRKHREQSGSVAQSSTSQTQTSQTQKKAASPKRAA